MADEREVSIRISASNLTGPEFDKVRAALAQVRQTSESTSASAQKLQRDYASLQAASMKLADASGQVYTDMTRVRSLTQQFGGGTALRSAEEYAAAVSRVGGASRLTASEQATVNRVVSEAIAKYKALGQEAPAHLLALQRETAKVETMWTKLDGALGKVGLSLNSVGKAAVGAAIVNMGRQALEASGHIVDLSNATGLSYEGLQRLAYAGKLTGVELDSSAAAVQKVQKALVNGQDGAVEAVSALGLSVDELLRMSPDRMFETIWRQISKLPDPAQRTAASMNVFGKAGAALLPMVSQNIDELTRGFTAMSDASIEANDRAGDAIDDFKDRAVRMVGNTLASFTSLHAFMRNWGDTLFSFVPGENPVKTIDDVTDALVRMGRAAAEHRPRLSPEAAPGLDRASDLLAQETADLEKQKKAADEAREARERLFGIDAINAAKAYASTLGSVSNVSKLTTDKQKELYAAVEKALEVYRRLGIEAPASLRQLHDALNPVVGKMHEFASLYSATLALQGLKAGSLLSAPNFAAGLPRNDALPGMTVGASLTPSLSAAIWASHHDWDPSTGRTDGRPVAASSGPSGGALKFGSDLSTTILSAVTGGGNIGQALGSGIGQQIGQKLSADLSKSLSESKTAGTFAKGLGGMFAGALPVIGALAGPLIGKVVDIFTGGAKANNLRDQLKARFGDAAGAGLQGAIDQMKNLPGLEEAYSRFMRAGSEKDVQRAFDDLTAKMQTAQQTLDKYGLSLDDLKSPQERFAAATQTMSGELNTLKGLGFSNTQIAKGMAGSLNELVRSALDAGGKIPAAFQPLLEQLIKSGGLADDVAAKLLGIPEKAKTPWKEMQEIAEEFGIDIEALGINFQQARLIENGEELARKWKVLAENGADINAVMAGMSGKANDFLQNALKWGLEVPESMRPMLEKMQAAGLLTDANGQKLKDLGDVKWAADPAKQFDPLILALNRLVDYFEKDLPSSLDTLRREAGKGFTIPVEQTGWSGGGGGQDSDGDGVPDSEDAVPFNPQYWANGGISEGRQIAVLSERGEREIVGSEQFMQNALSGAMQRMGFGSSSTFGQGGTGVIHLSVVMELGGRMLDARIKDVAQTAAARGELQIPARAVTVQVPRV